MCKASLSVVVAAYRIPDICIDGFLRWNEDVFAEHDVSVVMVLDKPRSFQQAFVMPQVYPRVQKHFSIPKTVNYGIKRAGTDIVVKSDVDIIFGGSIIEHIREVVTPTKGFVGTCANLQLPQHAKTQNWVKATKRRQGKGACFALHRITWATLCGYNERIYGWGADDNEMYKRTSKFIQVEVSEEHRLWHVDHQERKSHVAGSFFEFRSQENLAQCAIPWNDARWGEAKP